MVFQRTGVPMMQSQTFELDQPEPTPEPKKLQTDNLDKTDLKNPHKNDKE
jgi:hypothetical protein